MKVLEKLRGKKRSLVTQVVTKLLVRANIHALICYEIGEMVYEDLKYHLCSEDITL